MPIIEVGSSDEFIEEMRKMFPAELAKEKGGAKRYRLIIASVNRRIVFQPKVTTQRLNNILLRDSNSIDEDKITKAAQSIDKEIEITKCKNFWFDERKEPPIWPPSEKKEESKK
mgnify:CR=1 FL=1